MPLAIRAGKLFDGSGDLKENMVLLIDNERITAVGSADDVSIPTGYEVVDASEQCVIPGMIDCHVHLLASGEPGDKSFGIGEVTMSEPDIAYKCYKHAVQDLEAGFTTLRDAACRAYADTSLRNAINRGDLVGPRLWTCGLGITSTTGHMDREKYLAPGVRLPGPKAVADDPTEGRKVVRQNLRYDVDFIKINATLTEHVRRYHGYCAPEMTKETMAAIVEEAHWHGRKVTAHCYGGDGATWAIEAGIDGIEHGFYLSDEQLDTMAERGVDLCPTLSVVGRFRDMENRAEDDPNPLLNVWRKKAIANAWQMVARAKERGVNIICGTDAAMPYVVHGTNAYELEMLVEAGLSPTEALLTTTSVAADALDIADVGRLSEGKFADLVVVDGNPLDNISLLLDLDKLPVVIKGGEIVADRRISRSSTEKLVPA